MKRITAMTMTALAMLLAIAAAPALAEDVASVYHGGLYFGSVIVEPGQTVDGDLKVIGGDATIEGVVQGNVDVIGGSAYERPGGLVTGQVRSVGGDVVGAVVPWPAQLPAAPAPDYHVFSRVATGVVALLFFLVFPLRTRIALDRLERHPGLSSAVGLLGWVAVIPIALLLLCTIVLIPFIALEAIALIAAVFLGKAALALLVGRRLCELIKPEMTPAPLIALIAGLVLITAAELVPVVGALVTAFVLLIGVGAAILAFTGSSLIDSAARPVGPRPPVSGPPMPAA